MYCPRCLAEYRDGFTMCVDCHALLLAGPRPGVTALPEESARLVTVLEPADRVAFNLAIAALDDASIPYFVKGERSLDTYFGIETMCQIEVSAEFETTARELLEPLENPDPNLSDESKSE